MKFDEYEGWKGQESSMDLFQTLSAIVIGIALVAMYIIAG